MNYPDSLKVLIDSFKKLPSIGEKTAERLSFAVMNMSEEDINSFSKAIVDVKLKIKKCSICGNITENEISNSLYTAGQPDPDLLIRTSGEERISNFLPWQISYSEFVFTDKYWPEYSNSDLLESIQIYQKRTRRFGGNK